MRLWIETSCIYRLFACIWNCFAAIFKNSKTGQAAERIRHIWGYSHFGKMGGHYCTNEPLFVFSAICTNAERMIRGLLEKSGKVLDLIVKKLFRMADFPTFMSDKKVRYRLSALWLILVLGVSLCINHPLIIMIGIAALAAMWIFLSDYESAAYVLSLYALIDFVFRTYIAGLASIWDELFLIAMLALWVYKGVRYRREENCKQTPLDVCIWIFIGIYIILFLASPVLSIGLEGLRAIIQYMIWYFLVLQLLKDKKSVNRLLIVFACMAGCLAIHGIYQYIIGVEMPDSWVSGSETIRTRVYSILSSPNIFGSLNLLALPISFSLGRTAEKKRVQMFFYLFCVFMLASLVFTYSRGAWIGAVCAIGIYVLVKNKKLVVPAAMLGILVLIFVPGIRNRLLFMFSSTYLASSMKAGRLIRWLTALEILEEHPLTGLGLGQFGGAVAMNNGLSAVVNGETVKTYYMDNYYLKIAVEAGIIGLAAFLWLMYQVVMISLKTIGMTADVKMKEWETGILAGLSGVIVHNLVENVFEVPLMTSMFWMLAAVMMQMWYLNYKKEGNERNVKN